MIFKNNKLEKNLFIIILAAGQSSRLGRAKQLVTYKGKSLLQNAIDEAKGVNEANVMVVLGARYEELYAHILHYDVAIVKNELWSQGLSTSIRCAMQEIISKYKGVNKILFTVCDQPYVSTTLLEKIIIEHETNGKNIIASKYNETLGVPALFTKAYFNELMSLDGDAGAGKIIKKYLDQVGVVSFEKGEIDVDCIDDLDKI
jgi:molybdenum cofactor cytidylyltransferase